MNELQVALKNLQAAIALLALDADQSSYKASINELLTEAQKSISKARASGIGGGENADKLP